MPKITSPKRSKKKAHLKRNLVFFCSCCAAAIVLVLTGVNLRSFAANQVLGAKTEAPINTSSEEISFWENFLAKSPTYFDGWVELSQLMLSLGNKPAAEMAYNKAQDINPNSDKLGELRRLLAE
jgi:cytochrome c-type biogenesis protein CcmH/NrfG